MSERIEFHTTLSSSGHSLPADSSSNSEGEGSDEDSEDDVSLPSVEGTAGRCWPRSNFVQRAYFAFSCRPARTLKNLLNALAQLGAVVCPVSIGVANPIQILCSRKGLPDLGTQGTALGCSHHSHYIGLPDSSDLSQLSGPPSLLLLLGQLSLSLLATLLPRLAENLAPAI